MFSLNLWKKKKSIKPNSKGMAGKKQNRSKNPKDQG